MTDETEDLRMPDEKLRDLYTALIVDVHTVQRRLRRFDADALKLLDVDDVLARMEECVRRLEPLIDMVRGLELADDESGPWMVIADKPAGRYSACSCCPAETWDADREVGIVHVREDLVRRLARYYNKNTRLDDHEPRWTLCYFHVDDVPDEDGYSRTLARVQLNEDGHPMSLKIAQVEHDARRAAEEIADRRRAEAEKRELAAKLHRQEEDRARDLAALAKLRAQYPDAS